MTALEVLRSARARLSDPARWFQDPTGKSESVDENGHWCEPWSDRARRWDLLGAIWAETKPHDLDTCRLGDEACDLLAKATGAPPNMRAVLWLCDWHDASERTHADVLRAFDRAIEITGATNGLSALWSYELCRRERASGTPRGLDIDVRLAQQGDVPGLLRLQRARFEPDLHEPEGQIRAAIDAGHIWCAVAGTGSIVGSGWANVDGDAWHIHAIEVAPHTRHQRVGSQILSFLVRQAPLTRVRRVTAYAATDGGRALLKSFGFQLHVGAAS